jgi:hypothetical protein
MTSRDEQELAPKPIVKKCKTGLNITRCVYTHIFRSCMSANVWYEDTAVSQLKNNEPSGLPKIMASLLEITQAFLDLQALCVLPLRT